MASAITDRQVRNWFFKYCSGIMSLRDKLKPERLSDIDGSYLWVK